MISEGISPCLISMSFVDIAAERSNIAIPASRGVRSSLGRGPLKTIWPSFAYPIARPPTTAAWYRSFAMFFWVREEDILARLFHMEWIGNLQLLSTLGCCGTKVGLTAPWRMSLWVQLFLLVSSAHRQFHQWRAPHTQRGKSGSD